MPMQIIDSSHCHNSAAFSAPIVFRWNVRSGHVAHMKFEDTMCCYVPSASTPYPPLQPLPLSCRIYSFGHHYLTYTFNAVLRERCVRRFLGPPGFISSCLALPTVPAIPLGSVSPNVTSLSLRDCLFSSCEFHCLLFCFSLPLSFPLPPSLPSSNAFPNSGRTDAGRSFSWSTNALHIVE